MSLTPTIEPITDLVRDTSGFIKRLEDGHIHLTQRGRSVAVIFSTEEWHKIAEKLNELEDAYDVIAGLQAELRLATGEAILEDADLDELEGWAGRVQAEV